MSIIPARPHFYVLAEDGRTPVGTNDVLEWGAMLEDKERRHVGWDFDNEKRVTVSTVFLGLDHGYGDGPPVLFKTMIFGGRFERDEYQERYCTWEEAERGHERACELAGIKRRLTTWIDGEPVPPSE